MAGHRQHPPRASGAQHIADGIHHLPAGVFDGTAAGFGRRQQRFQQLPLPVVQVGGVIWSVHTPRLRHSARSSPSCLYASFYLFRHPLRACLRSLQYVKLRLLPEGVIMSHSYSSDISRGTICPDSSLFGVGPPPDQAPHRGLVRRFLRGALSP